jgi:hypothetical protein
MIVVQGNSDLLQVVGALGAPCRLAGRLDGGQKQGDQDGDDGNDHQQFNQSERTPTVHESRLQMKDDSSTPRKREMTCAAAVS